MAPAGNMYQGGNLDGAPASVTTTNQCTETLSGSSNALSLGCFGYVLMTFQGTGGGTVNLENGQQVAVFEYGSNCPTGSAADTYEVNLCTDTEAAVDNADSSSCTVVLGSNAEGYQTFSVGVPELRRAAPGRGPTGRAHEARLGIFATSKGAQALSNPYPTSPHVHDSNVGA